MSYPNQKFVIMDENDRVKIVTLREWAKWMGEHRNERTIGRDEVDGYTVSTIFLGLDHQRLPDGRPLYWETMVFGPPSGSRDLSGNPRELGDDIYQDRYSTAKEARAGHAKAVEWLKAKLKEEHGH